MLTKSLFVDYTNFPKLAWWKANDKDVYNKIRKIETEEDMDHVLQLGMSVENIVGEYLEKRHGEKLVDLFPMYPHETNDDEDNQEFTIDTSSQEWIDKLHTATQATLEAIKNKQPLLYQPSFLRDNKGIECFVRADFMVLNSEGTYDLIEVKAKSGIRKDVTDNKQKKKIGAVLPDLIKDVSFQTYVINNVLVGENLSPLGKKFLYHVNKEYVKQGELDIMKLIAHSEVDTVNTIEVIQRDKDVTLTINDKLLEPKEVEEIITMMQKEISLNEAEFNQIHPFPGNKYLEHFGEDKPFGTIFAIPKLHHSKARIVQELYMTGKIELEDLTDDEKAMFYSKTGLGSAGEFIEYFLTAREMGEALIDDVNIKNELDSLTFPICFYDYETVSVPVPYMDGTYAYQQVVVQYSLHKYYEDGTMKHYGGLMGGLEKEKRVETRTIVNNPNKVGYESEKIIFGNYKNLLEEMLIDIGEDINTSSFVVRYKPFENTRNKEIAELFPDLADSYLMINENTYDLMDVFAKKYYFDLGFQGSSSIKKVLPVLVPEMSYDGLGVGNGSVAMKALNNLLLGKYEGQEKEKMLDDLLLYCGQDSLAMVKIWEKLRKVI